MLQHGKRPTVTSRHGMVAAAHPLAAAAGVPVQLLHPALSGELIPRVEGHLTRLLDYLPGVLLAVRSVGTRPGLTIGLDSLL